MKRHVFVMVISVAVLGIALAACGGSENASRSSGSNAGVVAQPGIASDNSQKTAGLEPAALPDASGSGPAETNATDLAPSDQALFDRKIIQNTSMDLQVEDVAKSYDDVERIAITAGGFLLDSSVSSSQDKPSATLTIRVPTDQYQSVVDDLRALAIKVENETSKAEDVTDQYTDLQARLRSAQALEATYLGLLDKAQTIDDILKIQNYLTPVRTEIEQIQGQINVWDKLSSLATITVSLHSDVATPVPSNNVHPNPLKAGSAGWESSLLFLRAVGAGIFAVATFLWWLVPILLIVGAGFFLRYRTSHKPGSAG